MPRRKHWRTIHVAAGEYHWKVCRPNFESRHPVATDPHEIVVESEQERGNVLRVRFPNDDWARRVTIVPGMVRSIIEAAVAVGWGAACSEPRYWLGDRLSSYDQWAEGLRAGGD